MEVDGVSEILGACLVEKVDDDVADSEGVGSQFTRPCRFSGTPTFDTCLYFEVPQVLASKMKFMENGTFIYIEFYVYTLLQ